MVTLLRCQEPYPTTSRKIWSQQPMLGVVMQVGMCVPNRSLGFWTCSTSLGPGGFISSEIISGGHFTHNYPRLSRQNRGDLWCSNIRYCKNVKFRDPSVSVGQPNWTQEKPPTPWNGLHANLVAHKTGGCLKATLLSLLDLKRKWKVCFQIIWDPWWPVRCFFCLSHNYLKFQPAHPKIGRSI